MDAILAIVLPVFALVAAGYLAGRGGLRFVGRFDFGVIIRSNPLAKISAGKPNRYWVKSRNTPN